MRVESQPAFVLRSQNYLETSLLVDIYSRDSGRLKLVVKGARGGRSPRASKLQPFSELWLDWQGKSGLKTLTGIEIGKVLLSRPERLVAGMYLNELLFFLATEMDPQPNLYDLYAQTLFLLDDSPNIETVLRNFEFGMLEELGYAIDFSEDTNARAISAEHGYYYHAGSGFVRAAGDELTGTVPGLAILELAHKRLSTGLALQAAKLICRARIDLLLNGRELQSRKWHLKYASGLNR